MPRPREHVSVRPDPQPGDMAPVRSTRASRSPRRARVASCRRSDPRNASRPSLPAQAAAGTFGRREMWRGGAGRRPTHVSAGQEALARLERLPTCRRLSLASCRTRPAPGCASPCSRRPRLPRRQHAGQTTACTEHRPWPAHVMRRGTIGAGIGGWFGVRERLVTATRGRPALDHRAAYRYRVRRRASRAASRRVLPDRARVECPGMRGHGRRS